MTKQEIRKEEEHSSLLRLSSLSGLKKNKIIDSYLEILLLTFRLSKVSSIETSTINNLKEDLVNDILALNAKLNALKQYDEKGRYGYLKLDLDKEGVTHSEYVYTIIAWAFLGKGKIENSDNK